MLRLVTLAVAMVLGWATLDLRPVHAATATFDVDGGVKRTATALRGAIAKHRVDGQVWLGKLRAVGGGRDTLIHVPRDLDPARTIDLVVYLEGHGSFQDDAMDHRHAATIARLGPNTIYVAPDAPSSSHGNRTAKNPYWQPGCAKRRCEGGHAAPGDFLVFLEEVRTRIAVMTGARAGALDLRLSLIGFSNGGKGVVNAMTQLASSRFVAGDHPVRIADVIFADGNYGDAWLATTWRMLATRPEAPRLTILVGNGSFTTAATYAGNRRRAAAFWKTAAPAAPLPAADRVAEAPRLRLAALAGGHHAIGDAAANYLANGRAPELARASP